ncbi:major facilitator superfamily domain-containing protein [Pisolithus marmoratus]|nr:major facilitator superfamily domain-containing protein [Pisolithus marmoratus]
MAPVLDSRYNTPTLLGVRRIITLLGAIFVALSSGTNYIFSAYAPQLGARLHVSHTQLNVVGLAGNVGVAASGPVWGRIVDSRGPRILLAGAFVCSIVGYSGIKGSGTSLSPAYFVLLITYCLLTGLGANAGLTAAVNTVAKSFPESAFFRALGFLRFVSRLSHTFSSPETLFIVRPVPLLPTYPDPEVDQTRTYEHIQNGEVPFMTDRSVIVEEDDGRTPLLGDRVGSSSALEVGHAKDCSRPDTLLDIRGMMLFRTLDFYLLFVIMLLCIMYINNVGAITLALVAKSNPAYDETEASKQQGVQVSTLSVGNFVGRMLTGMSQAFAIRVSNVSTLRMATATLGLAYGSLFGILSVIIIDWFGLAHLSENSGYVCLAALVGGNVFSIMFGRNLDAHVPREDTKAFLDVARATNAASAPEIRDILSERQCLLGRECYVSSLKVTLVACMVALALSTWAALRDEHRKRLRKGMVDGYDEGFRHRQDRARNKIYKYFFLLDILRRLSRVGHQRYHAFRQAWNATLSIEFGLEPNGGRNKISARKLSAFRNSAIVLFRPPMFPNNCVNFLTNGPRTCIDSKLIVNTQGQLPGRGLLFPVYQPLQKVVLLQMMSDELASIKTPAHGVVTPLVSVLSHPPEAFFNSGVKIFHGAFDPCHYFRHSAGQDVNPQGFSELEEISHHGTRS